MISRGKIARNAWLTTASLLFLVQMQALQSFAQSGSDSTSGTTSESASTSLENTDITKDKSKLLFSGWTVYKGNGGKVRFFYPNNWIENKAKDEKFLLKVAAPDGLSFLI